MLSTIWNTIKLSFVAILLISILRALFNELWSGLHDLFSQGGTQDFYAIMPGGAHIYWLVLAFLMYQIVLLVMDRMNRRTMLIIPLVIYGVFILYDLALILIFDSADYAQMTLSPASFGELFSFYVQNILFLFGQFWLARRVRSRPKGVALG